ncbi:BnaCnng25750D [Brassica napus]|uniref:BnaCnng25750D protein n=1 Tax=Brassica napus TaxID=3708 RepID=A0A078IY35_BRANA|nr:BnaCnng25750D [Brassica napus]
MSSSYVLLANLRAGRCSNTAEVRLLRFWEARNSTLIHGSINSSRIDTFRRRLSEGSVYFLSGFDIARSNPKFRLSDSLVSIRFNDETFFETKTDSDKDIPTELFRFRSHEQLLTLANTNRDLPDIIGEVSFVRSTITYGLRGPQRVMMTLRLEGMFDDRAVTFQTKFDKHSSEPKVILFTNINPKVVGGKLFLNATSGTHFYFDCETSAGKEHYERYRVEFSEADHTDEAVFVAFDIEIAKLTNIQASEAAHILVSTQNILHLHGAGVNARVDNDFPPFLNEVVGKTFTFQLKLGEFNFTSKHQSFTVSRIISEHERAPLPAFVNDEDNHGPDENGDGAELADGVAPKIDESTVVNNKASASNVPYHGPQAANTQKLVNDGNVKKKARKE